MLVKSRAVLRCQAGATAIEYGLIVALIFVVMAGSLRLVAGKAILMWDGIAVNVETAIGDTA